MQSFICQLAQNNYAVNPTLLVEHLLKTLGLKSIDFEVMLRRLPLSDVPVAVAVDYEGFDATKVAHPLSLQLHLELLSQPDLKNPSEAD